MLSNQYLAAVIENGTNLLTPLVIVYLNTRIRATIEPQVIDLSEQSDIKVISSESEQHWKVDIQKYLDMV